ncbi:hypothetical protein [Streptomyces sp. NPDC002845]
MHGHGHAPPPPHRPSQGATITVRVVFVALAFLSCGMLAWVCLLRLATLTRRARDWFFLALGIVHVVAVFVILGTDPGEDEFTTWRGDVGMSLLLIGMLVIIAYYLSAEIRHFGPPRAVPYPQTTVYAQPQSGYGYPAQAPTPAPAAPAPQPYAPTPPVQQTPIPQPPGQPQRPAPARIDQVRAELDELSDYLRKHEDGS